MQTRLRITHSPKPSVPVTPPQEKSGARAEAPDAPENVRPPPKTRLRITTDPRPVPAPISGGDVAPDEHEPGSEEPAPKYRTVHGLFRRVARAHRDQDERRPGLPPPARARRRGGQDVRARSGRAGLRQRALGAQRPRAGHSERLESSLFESEAELDRETIMELTREAFAILDPAPVASKPERDAEGGRS